MHGCEPSGQTQPPPASPQRCSQASVAPARAAKYTLSWEWKPLTESSETAASVGSPGSSRSPRADAPNINQQEETPGKSIPPALISLPASAMQAPATDVITSVPIRQQSSVSCGWA